MSVACRTRVEKCMCGAGEHCFMQESLSRTATDCSRSLAWDSRSENVLVHPHGFGDSPCDDANFDSEDDSTGKSFARHHSTKSATATVTRTVPTPLTLASHTWCSISFSHSANVSCQSRSGRSALKLAYSSSRNHANARYGASSREDEEVARGRDDGVSWFHDLGGASLKYPTAAPFR